MDYTSLMNEFAEEFITGIEDVDGFILKSKSPSCGINGVKIYPKGKKCSLSKNGKGFFSTKVMERYPEIPIEDEGRLKNYNIRDEFFTKIFAINDFKATDSIMDFHKKNYLLLKSYNKKITNELEDIINKKNLTNKDMKLYKSKLYEVLNCKRSKATKIEACKSVFEEYKQKLNEDEIKFFENLITKYNDDKIPFSSLIVALQIYAVRFNDMNLFNQTFFNPYPESLVSVSDSGKGRKI